MSTRQTVRYSFDRNIIRYNWKSINNGPLKFAGLRVRAAAIRSIKTDRSKGRENYSQPGMPPRSRAPGSPIKRIYSVPDKTQSRVYVGAPYFSGYSGSLSNPVPGRHELGGFAMIRAFRRIGNTQRQQRIYTVSQLQHIQLWYRNHGNTQTRPRVRPTFTMTRRMVRFRPRPFMQPALEKVRGSLPSLWASSIR